MYLYAIWDSYRLTIVLNKMTLLADASAVVPFKISPFEINCLYFRRPWVAIVWSLFLPGLGQLQTDTLETMHLIRGDESGKYDGALILATIGMLLGVIYGMILYWGPVIWGLIGLIAGSSAGFAASRIYKRFSSRKPS